MRNRERRTLWSKLVRALKITCDYIQLFLVPLILTLSQLIPAAGCLVLKCLRVAKSEWGFKLQHLRGERDLQTVEAAHLNVFLYLNVSVFSHLCQSD